MTEKQTSRKAEEKYERIFAQAPLCIVSVGLDGRFLEATHPSAACWATRNPN